MIYGSRKWSDLCHQLYSSRAAPHTGKLEPTVRWNTVDRDRPERFAYRGGHAPTA